jgi:flagellar motor protein MotB
MIEMRHRSLNDTHIDVWPAFTDFITSVLLIVVLFVFGIFFTNVARELLSVGNEINLVRAKQRAVADRLVNIPGVEVQESGNLQRIVLHVDKEGKGGVLFDSGKAELKEQGKEMLGRIVAVLKDTSTYYKTIQVEGHTDDRPISSFQYRSNWELSAARAGAVVSYLLSQQNVLEPWRFSANGRGEYRPYNVPETEMKMEVTREPFAQRYPADTLPDYVVKNNARSNAAALNRRIEIILIY